MIKVSVLVAVYNSEKYLSQCLNSLINQTLKDIQVICIDDCSIDSSLKILYDYAEKDNRIDVIHLNENKGPAHARNQGLLRVKGKYVCFLDSDDWFAPDALELAVNTFEKYPLTGCVLFDCHHVDSVGEKTPFQNSHFIVKSGTEAFIDSLTWKIHGVYMVTSEIHFRFPYDETCKTYSDDNTTRLHYFNSKEVRECSGIYYYRQNNNSITHIVNTNHLDYLRANESMMKTLLQLNCDKDVLHQYHQLRWLNLVGVYYFYFRHRPKLSKSQRQEYTEVIHEFWKKIIPDKDKQTDKFGYRHCKSWQRFKLQEELYFFLRCILDFFRKN